MEIDYDDIEDVLFIRFSNDKIIRDISYGWNVNVGFTERGIGQITVLDADAAGLLPLHVKPSEMVKAA
ncbi:MAG: DUF2283 domain-containing protein [Desulfococcaceae bacterium]